MGRGGKRTLEILFDHLSECGCDARDLFRTLSTTIKTRHRTEVFAVVDNVGGLDALRDRSI